MERTGAPNVYRNGGELRLDQLDGSGQHPAVDRRRLLRAARDAVVAMHAMRRLLGCSLVLLLNRMLASVEQVLAPVVEIEVRREKRQKEDERPDSEKPDPGPTWGEEERHNRTDYHRGA